MTLRFERGTSPGRHPWFVEQDANLSVELLKQRYGDQLERREQITQNFGILGGWLFCVFWTVRGDPTGVSRSVWTLEYASL